MRSQLDSLMGKFGFAPNGHAGKALAHALTALPHDILISFDEADLERVATTMMTLMATMIATTHMAMMTTMVDDDGYVL